MLLDVFLYLRYIAFYILLQYFGFFLILQFILSVRSDQFLFDQLSFDFIQVILRNIRYVLIFQNRECFQKLLNLARFHSGLLHQLI